MTREPGWNWGLIIALTLTALFWACVIGIGIGLA